MSLITNTEYAVWRISKHGNVQLQHAGSSSNVRKHMYGEMSLFIDLPNLPRLGAQVSGHSFICEARRPLALALVSYGRAHAARARLPPLLRNFGNIACLLLTQSLIRFQPHWSATPQSFKLILKSCLSDPDQIIKPQDGGQHDRIKVALGPHEDRGPGEQQNCLVPIDWKYSNSPWF